MTVDLMTVVGLLNLKWDGHVKRATVMRFFVN